MSKVAVDVDRLRAMAAQLGEYTIRTSPRPTDVRRVQVELAELAESTPAVPRSLRLITEVLERAIRDQSWEEAATAAKDLRYWVTMHGADHARR